MLCRTPILSGFVTHYRNGLLRINTGPRTGSGSQLLTLQKQHGRVIFEGFKRNYVKAAYTNSLPVMDVKEDTAVKDVLLVGFVIQMVKIGSRGIWNRVSDPQSLESG